MKLCLIFLLSLTALAAVAQDPAPPSASAPAQATVHFNFDWSQGIPWQKYTIAVDSDGKSSFNGIPGADETRDTDPYQQDFTMSAANRQKVFDLAQKLNYFRGDVDSHLKHIAQTGKKTLQYQSPQVQGTAIFNWSQNPDVEQLTRLFQGIANTIDFGRKLAFQYRFDKLGMDKRLKELEGMASDHTAEELAIIAPILRKIANDPNLMNISRQTARNLLQAAKQPPPLAQNPAQD